MLKSYSHTILGKPVADIIKLAHSVIKRHYDPKGIVKLSAYDKEDLSWQLAGAICEVQHTYNPSRGRLESWMWGVAKNELFDYLNDEQKRIITVSSIDKPNSRLARQLEDIEDTYDTLTREEYNALEAEISRLPAESRLIITLYRNKVSEKEIAQRLNLNYNTVRQKIRRIKNELAVKITSRLEHGYIYPKVS